jgi:hypothetical protein
VQKQIDPLIAAASETEKSLLNSYAIYRKFKKIARRKRKYVKKQKPPAISSELPKTNTEITVLDASIVHF